MQNHICFAFKKDLHIFKYGKFFLTIDYFARIVNNFLNTLEFYQIAKMSIGRSQ